MHFKAGKKLRLRSITGHSSQLLLLVTCGAQGRHAEAAALLRHTLDAWQHTLEPGKLHCCCTRQEAARALWLIHTPCCAAAHPAVLLAAITLARCLDNQVHRPAAHAVTPLLPLMLPCPGGPHLQGKAAEAEPLYRRCLQLDVQAA